MTNLAMTTSGATTTTDYLAGGLEEIAANGSTVTTTKYYSVPGVCTVVNAGGTLSYLAQDGLGSVTAALSTSGSVTATQLYAPYGGVRYSSGSMPTAKGFTGQQADAATGLDYYSARYYDPVLGQFTSADSDALGGLNRYGYVAGNPETATDPTGHRCTVGDCGAPPGNCTGNCGKPSCWPNCGGNGNGTCHSDASCGCYTDCTPPPNGSQPSGNPPNGTKQTSSDAKITDPLTINATCSNASDHPGWCSRYYDYHNGIALPKTGDLIGSADYYWIQLAWNNLEITVYVIRATGEVLIGGGMALGEAMGFFLFGSVLAAGFGVLDTEGTPSAQQVHNFIKGLTFSGSMGALVDDTLVYSPSAQGWAEQFGAATGVILYAAGLEYAFPQTYDWSYDPVPLGPTL